MDLAVLGSHHYVWESPETFQTFGQERLAAAFSRASTFPADL
jgi:hypothetical protein